MIARSPKVKAARVERARDVDEAMQAISDFMDSEKHAHAVVEKTDCGVFVRVATRAPLDPADDDAPSASPRVAR